MAVSASDPSDSYLSENIIAKFRTSPLTTLLLVFISVCIYTRFRTGIQHRRQSISKIEPKDPAVLPYWIPWLGHALPFLTRFQDFLADASKNIQDGVFHIVLAGTVHNIAIAPSVAQQVLLEKPDISSANDFVYWSMEKFFGDRGQIRTHDPAVIFGKLHQVVFQLNREPFVTNAATFTAAAVEQRIHNLVSFAPSWVDQSIWERAASVSVHSNVAEANFFSLVRYFVGDIAATALMGQEFMANNPAVLSDLFTFDASFTKMLAGIPRWVPGMGPAYAARERLVHATGELQEALHAVWEDRNPGSKWNDLSDVSNVMQGRAREWRNITTSRDLSSRGDLGLLWALNVNANQLIFWFLSYVYRDATLRSEILTEIAPFVKLTPPEKSDLPIPEPPKLSINQDGLVHECPLLKAAYYETLRLESPSASYKAVKETFSVTESAEDAAIDGKAEPQTYRFQRGSLICIAHHVHAMDARYWEDPKKFNPRRFFKEDEKQPGKVTVNMGSMRVFGGGATMCKGRAFAEREVLIFAAAILTSWDVQPVGSKGWGNLGRSLGSGVYLPKRDVRVRLTRKAPV